MKIHFNALLLFVIIFTIVSTSAYAENNREKLFEDDLKKSGYIPLNQAVKEFEQTNKKSIKLPTVPFEANIKLGKISTEGYLKLRWIKTSEKEETKDFILYVKNNGHGELYFADENEFKRIELEDGKIGYFDDYNSYRLVFEEKGLEYCYLISKNDGFSKKEFFQIAGTFK